jgi:hypothetical protein
VTELEKFTDTKGRITVLNNQLVPIEIPELAIDGNVHSSVRIDYEIQRYTGTEYRSSTGTLHFCLKQNGVWMTDRNIVSFDVDGITFSINTVLSKQGKVFTLLMRYLEHPTLVFSSSVATFRGVT